MKVGFVVTGAGASWLGGAHYFKNLFAALAATPEAAVDGWVFHGEEVQLPPPWADRGRRLEILRTGSLPWAVRGAVQRLLDRDLLLERRLAAAGVELISHPHVGRVRLLPAVTWIPDVQHRHLPDLFPAAERRGRDRIYASAARGATLVLASSEAARRDIEAAFPAARGRVRVLRFVATVDEPEGEAEGAAGRLGLPERFLLLPNQFWVHKNHGLVVEALRLLRLRGTPLAVVCTGGTQDYRHPGYFQGLMTRVREAGVEGSLRILGRVSAADLAWLLRRAVAVLNPSRFEGWSTSVEEGKSLGKRVVLSDLPVHREQAPERASYFPPDDAAALADAMLGAWTAHDPAEEAAAAERARAALPGRVRDFALSYAAIAREAIALGPRHG